MRRISGTVQHYAWGSPTAIPTLLGVPPTGEPVAEYWLGAHPSAPSLVDGTRLDTLFLTMPIAWKGTLAQYVGRLHRQHDGKKDVLVVDYVDSAVPVLARMAAKRRSGYRALGYVME